MERAFESLAPLARVHGEDHIDEITRDESGAVTSAVLSWVKAGNRQHKEWDDTILGTLRLGAGRLVAEVNSARRADRVKREIAKRMPETTIHVDTRSSIHLRLLSSGGASAHPVLETTNRRGRHRRNYARSKKTSLVVIGNSGPIRACPRWETKRRARRHAARVDANDWRRCSRGSPVRLKRAERVRHFTSRSFEKNCISRAGVSDATTSCANLAGTQPRGWRVCGLRPNRIEPSNTLT